MLKIRILYQLPKRILKSSLRERELKDGITIRQDLKATFGFKPMFSGQRIILSLGGGDPIVYDSMTKALEATGMPISTIVLAKERTNTIHPVTFKSKGNEYTLRIDGLEDNVKGSVRGSVRDNVRAIIEDEVENETENLTPISHKEFNEFIKGKGFVGRNNYKLKDLKAMFGFKPMVARPQVSITIDDGEGLRFYVKSFIICWNTISYVATC